MGPTLLSTEQAQVASDVKLQSGELRPWHKEVFVLGSNTPNTKTLYQLQGPANATGWLAWSTDVDVVTSPVGDSIDYRFYYTGDGTPRKSNWGMAAAAGGGVANYYEMGVPAPTGAPTCTVTAGSGNISETRSYIYTYVSTFGNIEEESAPSPATLVICHTSGDTVTVTGFTAPPAGHYNITKRRIYRSVTGTTSTVYQQVAEIPLSTTSYADTKAVTTLGGALQSLNYTPPPSDLTGLVSLPCGSLAGFRGNEIWFSEPGLPHAWPAIYVLTTEFPIVGLGVYNTSVVIMTTKHPYLLSGSHPALMSQEKLSLPHACVSKRSIAYDQHGVIYASPYGLVNIGFGYSGVQDVITTQLLAADDWQKFNPSTMSSILFGNFYMGFYDDGGTQKAIVLARNNDTPPLSTFSFPATAVFLQRLTGRLFACSQRDNGIYQLDANTLNNTRYTWTSKKFIAPAPTNFAAMQISADFVYLNDTTANAQAMAEYLAAIKTTFTTGQTTGVLGGEVNAKMCNVLLCNGSDMLDGPVTPEPRFVQVTVTADQKPIIQKILRDFAPIRMPAGFKAYEWEVSIYGNVPVRSFAMATTMQEIKQV
jgi:hypothetical protein